MRNFFKTFLLFSLMFAAPEGFSSSKNVDTLYKETLIHTYSKLQELKTKAQKRKTTYIVSAVLALVLLAVFTYFFKLIGLFTAILMIAAGYFTIKSSEPVVGLYKKQFQKNIITPITRLTAGFTYAQAPLNQEILELSQLFAPEIKQFGSWDLYEKEGERFSYIHVEFDTKEDDSVERIAENIFDGYLIMIDAKNQQEGVLISLLYLYHYLLLYDFSIIINHTTINL